MRTFEHYEALESTTGIPAELAYDLGRHDISAVGLWDEDTEDDSWDDYDLADTPVGAYALDDETIIRELWPVIYQSRITVRALGLDWARFNGLVFGEYKDTGETFCALSFEMGYYTDEFLPADVLYRHRAGEVRRKPLYFCCGREVHYEGDCQQCGRLVPEAVTNHA